MTFLVLLALVLLALIVWRALNKVKDDAVTGVLKLALPAILTLVLTYVAMRIVPADVVPDLLRSALKTLRA